MSTATTPMFSPSELVLLHGGRFAARPSMLDKTTLLDRTTDVSLTSLARTLLATALLANEQAGALKIEVRPKKALFGLRTVETLFVDPGGASVEWPEQSLEAQLQRAFASRGSATTEAVTLFFVLLGEDTYNPNADVVRHSTTGLIARNLLEVTKEKRLKIFSTTQVQLPDETAALAARQPIEPLQQLLTGCEQGRPQLWKLLTDHVKGAITRRTKQSDSFND